jgi:hypothetical protein
VPEAVAEPEPELDPADPTAEPSRLAIRYRRVSDLRTYYKNARRGNVEAIVASLRAHGQYKPIVVNRGTYTGRPDEVAVGNHTLTAMREMGAEWIATVDRDYDEDQLARVVLADNRTADLGTYDEDALAGLLGGLEDLEGTGYSEADRESILALADDDSWNEDSGGGGGRGKDDEDDADAMWPKIAMLVTPEVFEGWRALLDAHDGKNDHAKLVEHLRSHGLME